MADVINVSDLRYLRSVNTPNYPEPTWKHHPDMTAVAGVAQRYWIWDAVAERPIEMNQAAKDVVDADILTSELDGEATKVDDIKDIIRALSQLLVVEFNTHKEILDAASTATSFTEFQTAMAVIETRPTWTLATFRTALRANLGS